MKPLEWVGASKKDYLEFPDRVQDRCGYDLWVAQCGGKPASATPLRGFGGAGVLEIRAPYAGDTYRAVYTVELATAVYVLHCWQKKSARGRETAQIDSNLIRLRLEQARAIEHEKRLGERR